MNKQMTLLMIALTCLACNPGKAPEACGPLPSPKQLDWHTMETYAFVHFNMNTFTDSEWGSGSEDPALFNPDRLDCRQWVRIFKDAGLKGVILTAKHHDGFCLWPTATTEHSVKHSPWKDGKGDVVRELSDACREAGLKFGVYLSPWDRNNASYGTPEYIGIFRTQLKELLTQYGPVFEVWFDGANGGSGYYGGANETRTVDRRSYYDWPGTCALVNELQPEAVIFSDAGPDVRWVGNEQGYADKTNWSLLRREEFWPGCPMYQQLTSGHEDGTHWVPAEVDVSIRPGWYYHDSQDNQVKSLPQLLDIYYHSVGRNASMLLNVPADRHGRIADTDAERLYAFKAALDADFRTDLAPQAKVSADCDRGSDFSAARATDLDNNTYWGAPDSITQGTLIFRFPQAVDINRILLQEPITLGQRIQQFSAEALIDGQWQTIAEGTTVGYKRILRTADFTATAVKIKIDKAKAAPLLSTVSFYRAPRLLSAPVIRRNKAGMASISSSDNNTELHYTTDGSHPDSLSPRYQGPFPAKRTTVKAVAVDKAGRRTGPTAFRTFDIAKTDWTLPGHEEQAVAIDDDEHTACRPDPRKGIIIDLGKAYELQGFTYLPEQLPGNAAITEYEFSVSKDGKQWGKPVSEGEFANIANSPTLQTKHFKNTQGRYIQLKARKVHNNAPTSGIAEIGIITR